MVNINREKFIIYQVLPRLFGNANDKCIPNSSFMVNGSGKFDDFDTKTLHSIKELGCTHIWFTGIIEHSTKTDYSKYGIIKDNPSLVKGEAGSPYAIKDYFDVDPDLALEVENRISEFKSLIDRTHKQGLKVIIDFVPNHLAREYFSDSKPKAIKDFGVTDKKDYAFHPMNNFYYILDEYFKSPILSSAESDDYTEFPARATGNDCFCSEPVITDWFETVKLNYGVDYQNGGSSYFNPIPDTWKKMFSVLQYWISMGVDGFRCDMAEMVPVEFWNWVIKNIKKKTPETLFIAEIYQPEKYYDYLNIGGFDYLYDKVGLYDTLKGVLKKELPASSITLSWQSLGEKQSRMLNFLENHDEQRIASDFFLGEPFKAVPAVAVSLLLNTSPFMIYFGQELGERGMDYEGFSGIDGKTSIFDYWSLKSVRNWRNTRKDTDIRKYYKKILGLSTSEKAFYKGLTYDLEYVNPISNNYNPFFHFSFLRFFENELILVVVNFDEKDASLRINIPKHAFEYFETTDQIVNFGEDLISGDRVNEILASSIPYKIHVRANDVILIKFLLQ